MTSNVRQLLSARELVLSWTSRTIKARYQQSTLGWLWAVIQPAASVAIFTVIFTLFVPVDTGGTPYIVFSYVAMVPWTFFASTLADMTDSLVQNMGLVTKIYFPREALPIAAMLARLLDFGVAAGLLVILMVYFRLPFYLIPGLFLPAILAIELALVVGLGLAAGAINVFFRDVQPLVRLIIQLWFYACPIIYPTTLVPERLRPFYYLNPMTGVLQAYREVLLDGEVPGTYLLLSALIALLVFLAGYWLFKRVEYQFADLV
jgi:lipopolysaccharide transport system permease protein